MDAFPRRTPPKSRRIKQSSKTDRTEGNYLDEVWTIDDRTGAGSVGDLNDGTGSERHFYHQNTLYSVYGLTDEAANLVESYMYDSYGRQTVITDGNDGDAVVNFNANDVHTLGGNSLIGNPWMFTGQRLDSETGLGYWKNRFMSYDLGKWMTRDPIGYEGGSLGLYEYAESAPNIFTDPFGLYCCVERFELQDKPAGGASAVARAARTLSQGKKGFVSRFSRWGGVRVHYMGYGFDLMIYLTEGSDPKDCIVERNILEYRTISSPDTFEKKTGPDTVRYRSNFPPLPAVAIYDAPGRMGRRPPDFYFLFSRFEVIVKDSKNVMKGDANIKYQVNIFYFSPGPGSGEVKEDSQYVPPCITGIRCQERKEEPVPEFEGDVSF